MADSGLRSGSFKMYLKIYLLLFYLVEIRCQIYDRYTGKRVDSEKPSVNGSSLIPGACTLFVPECNPKDYRSHDGSCNNLKRPTQGTRISPFLRMLPAAYSMGGQARVQKDGTPLPLARRVRTTILQDGRVSNKRLTVASFHMFEYLGADQLLTNGMPDYLVNRRYCCTPAGAADPRCMPIIIPDDDPYLKNSGERCMNFTRTQTFQDMGCIPNTLPPAQVNLATTAGDLHFVYGTTNVTNRLLRTNKDGLMRTEERKGREMPPLGPSVASGCLGNQPNETDCYMFGDPAGNFDLRLTTINIFFLKEHNRIARLLKKINPCWSDDQLYNVSRKINIAVAQKILFYEVLATLYGKKNLENIGLIQDKVRFVNEYDPHLDPLLYIETAVSVRFFHGIIEGRVKLYDKHYRESRQYWLSNTMFRSSVVEEDYNFEGLNRGTFYQRAGRNDRNVDPDFSETFFSGFFRIFDVISADIERCRDLGLRPYNDYRKYCGLPQAKKFEDFADVMDYERIDELKSVYEHVDDVDLIAGIHAERFLDDSEAGPTLTCLTVRQMLDYRRSDRYWFERGDHHQAFTKGQLYQIRKTGLARLACDNASGIKAIQPNPLIQPQKGNEVLPCDHIPGLDLTEWADHECRFRHYSEEMRDEKRDNNRDEKRDDSKNDKN